MPKFFDIHSHLNVPEFDQDWPEVLERTLAGDCWTIAVGAGLASSKRAVEIANSKPEGIWATVGVHPTEAIEEGWFDELKELAQNLKVVAIGECGLEYLEYEGQKIDKAKQQEIFKKQIELALGLDKPLMIHCRPGRGSEDAYLDAIDILNEYKQQYGDKLRGDFHFFAGNWETAQKCLDLGFTLSFTGVITFSHQYDEVIKKAPLERIMAETDAPFVSPVPYRGKRCEPLYVAEVVKRIAELRGMEYDKMAEILVKNTLNVFDISVKS